MAFHTKEQLRLYKEDPENARYTPGRMLSEYLERGIRCFNCGRALTAADLPLIQWRGNNSGGVRGSGDGKYADLWLHPECAMYLVKHFCSDAIGCDNNRSESVTVLDRAMEALENEREKEAEAIDAVASQLRPVIYAAAAKRASEVLGVDVEVTVDEDQLRRFAAKYCESSSVSYFIPFDVDDLFFRAKVAVTRSGDGKPKVYLIPVLSVAAHDGWHQVNTLVDVAKAIDIEDKR